MNLIKFNKDSLRDSIEVLKSGGVVAHPTDTCYGLAADIFNNEAVGKILKIKQREPTTPFTIAVHVLRDIPKYGILSPLAKKIIHEYFPGAVTLVVPRTSNVPVHFFPDNEFIGIRVPNHKLTLSLARGLGHPITTTSANISGKLENYTGQGVFESFYETLAEPDLIFNLDIEDQISNKPSTVVKIVGDKMEVLRQGNVRISLDMNS